MATGGDPEMFPLWDSRNKEQEKILGLTLYERRLNKSNVVLRENLRISEVLPHLRQLGVFTRLEEAELTHNAPNHIMVDRLLHHLKRCSMWCFHGLLRACALTNQRQLIREVGHDPDDYLQEGEEAQFTRHAADFTPHPTQIAAQAVHITLQATHTTPQATHITPQAAQFTPHPAQFTTNPAQFTPHPAQFTPLPTQFTPHPAQAPAQAPHITPRAAHIPPQTAQISPQAVQINPQAWITPHLHQITPQATQITPQAAHITPQTAEFAPQATQFTPQATQFTPQATQFTPHPTQITPETAQLTPREQLIRAITDHNQGNTQTLMRRNIYDFGNSSSAKVLDTTTCHIEVDTEHEDKDGKMRDVPEGEILTEFPGEKNPPRVIRIYGQPGVGKTGLVQHIGYVKSVEFLKRLGSSSPVTDRELNVMVYIAARSIKDTMKEAIYDNLRCQPEDKDILYNHVMTGNGTIIGLDAIDEIRSREVMENVKKYVSDRQSCGRGPCIIVTSRTDLCPIETQAFDRFLVAKGFTEAQGIAYIEAYLSGETCKKVLEYACLHREKLYPVITNPLRCHLMCALVSEGELELNENDDFCILKLFTLLEKCLLKREGKKVTIDESKRFYAMCMNGLLHGLREFSQDLLDEYQIAESFLVLLTKKKTTSLEGKQVTHSFPHEILYEVFAGKYIESLSFEGKKLLLLAICTRPTLRNLQRIVFEVLTQQEANQELLQTMARAILILQHKHSVEEKPTGFFKRWFTMHGKLVNLHKQIQPPETLDMSSLELQSKKQAKDINKTWDTINKVFDEQSAGLQMAKWYLGLGDGVFGHVTECLQVCPPEQQEILTKNTTEQLLPCEYKKKNKHRFVCDVGKSRWAEVTFNTANGDVSVDSWCLEDAMSALYQARLSTIYQSKSQPTSSLTMNTNKFRELWGQPSHDPTPVVQHRYPTELKDWSQVCESFNFVYSVGLSHHARLSFNTQSHKIDVFAWGLEDAKEALYQARLWTFPSLKALLRRMIESITIHPYEYEGLWGQLPSLPSIQDVDSQLSQEFAWWKPICERWHTVLAVGKSRWVEIVINKTQREMELHAWCPNDATEALHESRKSGDTVQQAAGYAPYLHINKDQSMWGQPALSAFTPDVWRQLLVEYRQWSRLGVVYNARFMLGRSTPLHGLLLALCENESLGHVHDGIVGLQDLYSMVHKGQLEAGGCLHSPAIVVPADVDQAVFRKMRDKLWFAEDRYRGTMVVSDPNFVTEAGEEYVWEEG